DDLVHGLAAPAAVLLGPGDPGPAAVVERALPGLAAVDVGGLVVGAGPQPRGEVVGVALGEGVGVEPGPGFGPERGFLRRVVDVHGPRLERVLPRGRSGQRTCHAGLVTPDPIPSLPRFGWREVARGAEIWVVLALWLVRAIVVHAVRHPRTVLAARRDPAARRALADAASVGLVEAFMTLGPTFVKLGQMVASSPGMFPAPLADACLRTLDD